MTCCVPSLLSADEEQQRDVVRAAGPRQRAPEERGAGMPRRRRNLAASMANRRPQREDVENGKRISIVVMLMRKLNVFYCFNVSFFSACFGVHHIGLTHSSFKSFLMLIYHTENMDFVYDQNYLVCSKTFRKQNKHRVVVYQFNNVNLFKQ